MNHPYAKTKYACYITNMSMSIVATLSPLLFITFHNMYDISFSLLGTLVLINFCTQLIVDLLLSFYSHKFDMSKMVKITPLLTAVGLFVYAVFPFLFPNAVYTGLVIGTIIFSASSGLAEVLISPVIAAIPSENPEREMSKLHSTYAWGVVGVVIISTIFLMLCGRENWQWLALLWIIIPLISCILFWTSEIPPLKTPENTSHVFSLLKGSDFLLYFFCIFLGGASENTMAQWSSGYLEQVFNIPKIQGDVLGVACFFIMLGTGRTLYSKIGKNIYKVLLMSSIGATLCYVIATFSDSAVIGLISCVMTGFCTAMLWPGSLIAATDRFPSAGVAVFALMAAGGDLGSSIAPQLVGLITDFTIQNPSLTVLAADLNMNADQLGMKIGLLAATIFPLLAIVLFTVLYKRHQKQQP